MLENVMILLKKNASLIYESLQEGTSDELIKQLETCTGKKRPNDLIQLYKEFNGINPECHANFAYGIPFIPIENSIKQIKMYDNECDSIKLKFVDSGIKSNYTFGKKRIPIGDDCGTSLLCVDLDPDENGLYGQLILLDYDNGVALKVNDSVEEYINQFEKDLSEDKYSLQEDALEDGVHWLEPQDKIDPVNWFNSTRWDYVKR